MKTLTEERWMEVPERRAIVSIHREVERLVAESGIQHGLALMNKPRYRVENSLVVGPHKCSPCPGTLIEQRLAA